MNHTESRKHKWFRDFLCRFLDHDWKFVRGERTNGFFGEALYQEYECKRCGKTDASITEGFKLTAEVNRA